MQSIPVAMPESIYDYIHAADDSATIQVFVLVPVLVNVQVPKR